MEQDPFGSLRDWGSVLDHVDVLTVHGQLDNCQAGLIRILRYKGNWRLREHVLKGLGEIESPCPQLLCQVLNIIDDDNLYYDVRILASDALIQLLKKSEDGLDGEIGIQAREVVDRLRTSPQPIFFDNALKHLHLELNGERNFEN